MTTTEIKTGSVVTFSGNIGMDGYSETVAATGELVRFVSGRVIPMAILVSLIGMKKAQVVA